MKERLKDPILWSSWISTVLITLKLIGVIQIDDVLIDNVTTSILSVISIFGAINNPENRKGI